MNDGTNFRATKPSSVARGQGSAHHTLYVQLFRHISTTVVQALIVLEFVIKRGSDQCVDNSRVLLSKLEDLQVFEYTSPDGHDHGVNVRHRYVSAAIL